MFIIKALLLYILFFIFLIFLYKRKGNFWMLPTGTFIIFYTLVVVLSPLYHYLVPYDQKFNFFRLDRVTNEEFHDSINICLYMMILIMTGVFIASIFTKKNSFKPETIDLLEKLSQNTIKVFLWIGIVLLLFATTLYYVDYGNKTFYRKWYMVVESNRMYMVAYKNIFYIISLIAGITYRKYKFISILIFIIVIMCGISLGSRATALYLLLFLLPRMLEKKYRFSKILLFPLILILFFGYMIALRQYSDHHGLFPYIATTFEKPEVIFVLSIENIYYSFIFGVYVTIRTLKEYTNPEIGHFITNINPMPGVLTDWYEINKELRIYRYVPFNLLGELYKFPVLFVIYSIFLGVYFHILDCFFIKLWNRRKYFIGVLFLGLIGIFTIHSFEYNFRSCHRFLIYSLVLYIIVWTFSKIKSIKFNVKK